MGETPTLGYVANNHGWNTSWRWLFLHTEVPTPSRWKEGHQLQQKSNRVVKQYIYLANWSIFHHPRFYWNKASSRGVPLLPWNLGWKLVWSGYNLTRSRDVYMCPSCRSKPYIGGWCPHLFWPDIPIMGIEPPDHHPYHRKTMVCKLRVFQTHTSHPGTVRCQENFVHLLEAITFFWDVFFCYRSFHDT